MWLILPPSTPSTSPRATTSPAPAPAPTPVAPTPIASTPIAPTMMAAPSAPPLTEGSLIAWLIKRSLVACSWICAFRSLWMSLPVCYSAPVRGAVTATLRTCTVTSAGRRLFTIFRVTFFSIVIHSASFTSLCAISWGIADFSIGRRHCSFASGCTMFYCFIVLKMRASCSIFWVADTALIILLPIASSTRTSAPASPPSRSLLLLIRSWLFPRTLSGFKGKSRWARLGTAVRDPACIPVRRISCKWTSKSFW